MTLLDACLSTKAITSWQYTQQKVTDPDTYQCEASNKDQYAGGVVTANQVKLNVKSKIVTHAPVDIEHSFLGHQVVIVGSMILQWCEKS